MRPELDKFRNTKVGNILSLVAVTAVAGIGANAVKATVSPDVASANPADATCTVTIEGNTETEICTSPSDPSYHSERVTTIEDNGEEAQEQAAPLPPPKAERKPPEKPRKRSNTRPKSERQVRINTQKDFPGYNMEASWFTDGNGCFITGAASGLRRETGNKHI